MLNVYDMAGRYHGVVNREVREGIYVVSVLLPFEKEKGEIL